MSSDDFAETFTHGIVNAGRYAGQRFTLLHELTLPGWWAVEIDGEVRDIRQSELVEAI